MAKKPSFAWAMREARRVKMQLASGGEPVSNKVPHFERPKRHADGPTVNDMQGKRQYNDWLLSITGWKK